MPDLLTNPLEIDCPSCEAKAGQECIGYVNVQVRPDVYARRSFSASPHLSRKDAMQAENKRRSET